MRAFGYDVAWQPTAPSALHRAVALGWQGWRRGQTVLAGMIRDVQQTGS